MSEHSASIRWSRENGEAFADGRYHRSHEWRFDGGATVHASASPSNVRVPMSDPSGVDPEEAFVAALSSCHMLWFLSIAAGRGIVVDRYEDSAFGQLGPRDDGRTAMTRVVLRPRVTFAAGHELDPLALESLHAEADRRCFIANAVSCDLAIEPVLASPLRAVR